MLATKYRPANLEGILGQDAVIGQLKVLVEKKEFPHLLFVGPAGCGKTSLSHAFATEIGTSVIELNASDERGIDTIRSKVKTLAFTQGKRIILLDESDALTFDAQHALRRIIERCAEGVRFILTCNDDYKIIAPIKSRCAIFYLQKLSEENLLKILIKVLVAEGVEKEQLAKSKDALLQLIKYVDGDARQALNMVETLLTQKLEITPANIAVLCPPKTIQNLLITAYEGKWEEALALLKNNSKDLDVKRFYEQVEELPFEPYIKLRIYQELARVERSLKIGCSPLVQYSSLLATIWVARHVPSGLKGEVGG